MEGGRQIDQIVKIDEIQEEAHEFGFVRVTRLQQAPTVYLLTFTGSGKHVFDPTAFEAIHKALDLVENSLAVVLITTNEGKFYSNGMDVSHAKGDLKQRIAYIQKCHMLLRRMLVFPIPTIAAIRGHAVGAGCLFALAHDYRYMRSDQGLIFMNEIDIGVSLTPGNSSIIACKVTPATYQEVVLTGRRYRANDAMIVGLIHASLPDSTSTLEATIKKGLELAFKSWKRSAYQGMKMEMFKSTIRELEFGGIAFAKL